MQPAITATLTIGANKGRPRLWIEGGRLAEAGFVRGAKFNVMPGKSGGLWLSTTPHGDRTVSGKGARPIIDILGRTLEAFGFKTGDEVTLEYAAGLILIRKVQA